MNKRVLPHFPLPSHYKFCLFIVYTRLRSVLFLRGESTLWSDTEASTLKQFCLKVQLTLTGEYRKVDSLNNFNQGLNKSFLPPFLVIPNLCVISRWPSVGREWQESGGSHSSTGSRGSERHGAGEVTAFITTNTSRCSELNGQTNWLISPPSDRALDAGERSATCRHSPRSGHTSVHTNKRWQQTRS